MHKSKEPDGHFFHNWAVFVYPIIVLLFLFYANIEVSRGDFEYTDLKYIHIMNEKLVWILPRIMFGVAMGLVGLSLISFWTRWLRFPGIGLVVGLVFYPCCFVGHSIKNLEPWTIHGQLTSEDGNVWAFCDSGFLQGQTMVLAVKEGQDTVRTTFRVMALAHGDSPRIWASILRDQAAKDDYGQIYQKNGMIIGVRYENRCYLAYDLRQGQTVGKMEIEKLSPFVGLSDTDSLFPGDLDRTRDRILEHARFCEGQGDVRHAQSFLRGEPVSGCPPIPELRSALASRSSAIAQAARDLLGAYDQAFSLVKKRLDREQGKETESGQPKAPGALISD